MLHSPCKSSVSWQKAGKTKMHCQNQTFISRPTTGPGLSELSSATSLASNQVQWELAMTPVTAPGCSMYASRSTARPVPRG